MCDIYEDCSYQNIKNKIEKGDVEQKNENKVTISGYML